MEERKKKINSLAFAHKSKLPLTRMETDALKDDSPIPKPKKAGPPKFAINLDQARESENEGEEKLESCYVSVLKCFGFYKRK